MPGKVLMLVENRFPADSCVRNEASTLAKNGCHVSVIAVRGRSEALREIVDGVAVYRVPRLTVSPLNDVSTRVKVMEYMALGKPIVSFDLKETCISAREAAVYVAPNDETDFAKAIVRLMDYPDGRFKMGEYDRLRVHEELNRNVTSRDLLKAHDRLFLESTRTS